MPLRFDCFFPMCRRSPTGREREPASTSIQPLGSSLLDQGVRLRLRNERTCQEQRFQVDLDTTGTHTPDQVVLTDAIIYPDRFGTITAHGLEIVPELEPGSGYSVAELDPRTGYA